MSEFKGTPGPWKSSYNGFFFEVIPSGKLMALASTQVNPYGETQDKANANLIAAAPELLEACLRMRNQLYAAGYEPEENSLNPTKCLLAQVEFAIAKALGQ